jgi:deoxycytidylate deaminase
MKHRLSAIIFDNNFNIISVGYNKWLLKGHYSQKPYNTSIHAEVDAILGIPKQDLWGSSILVFRYNYGLAKPCQCCMKVILSAGIHNIFYSNGKRSIEKL